MQTNLQAREVLAAAPDAIRRAAGAPAESPHPLAESLSLVDIAHAAGLVRFEGRERQGWQGDIAVMSAGLATGDFARALAAGVSGITLAAYANQAEHLGFTVPVDVQNYHPVAIPSMEADVDLEPIAEGAEIGQFTAFLNGGAREEKLVRFGRIVNLARQAIINNQMADFARLVSSLGASAARIESRLIAAALSTNPVLDDDAVLFDTTNTLEPTQFDGTALASAITMLRTQRTASGQRAGLRAKHLIVEPGLEFKARELVHSAGLDLVVNVLANLAAGKWFLLADPAATPVVGVLRLHGSKHPVYVEQGPRHISLDGSRIKVTADLGVALLRRVGIVNGTVGG